MSENFDTLEYATPQPRSKRWPMWILIIGVIVIALVLFLFVSRVSVTVTPLAGVLQTKAPSPQLNLSAPVDVAITQRQTMAIPGSNSTLNLRIGDITRGQTLLAVDASDRSSVVVQQSMKQGDAIQFNVSGTNYQLTVVELVNLLTGEDYARVRIENAGAVLSESQKIERLIESIEVLKDAEFIRNGEKHTAADAAQHLRRKLSSAGDKITTAEQFIDNIGSKSSLSDEPYRIRFRDGTEITSGDYLKEQSRKIEKSSGMQ